MTTEEEVEITIDQIVEEASQEEEEIEAIEGTTIEEGIGLGLDQVRDVISQEGTEGVIHLNLAASQVRSVITRTERETILQALREKETIGVEAEATISERIREEAALDQNLEVIKPYIIEFTHIEMIEMIEMIEIELLMMRNKLMKIDE